MKCNKCGITLSENSKYCIRCGKIFDSTNYIEDKKVEDVLYDYIIGETKKKNYSIGYLFFNFVYAFYKKMYIEGVISFIAVFGLIAIISNFLKLLKMSFGFYFLLYMYLIFIFIYFITKYIFTFDELYKQHIFENIKKIISENENVSLEQLKKICDKKCKDSILNAIIAVISIIFIIYIFIFNK